ncbi:hypothetical protein F0562_000813 [Nyssa sinensis]|uniref:Phi-1-like phosphate-induced protein n=1 Tax=Nyssa sinensis TaxID=561372 RepID=A0A5J5C1P4_9ASTE|nr:hypothetical protein F0562_000813 [Nyssa sinensis]
MPLLLLPLTMVIALAQAPRSQGLNQSLSQPSSLAPISTKLNYHGGPLLTRPSSINIYLIWYGAFYQKDRAPITDFLASFSPVNGRLNPLTEPTVAKWWSTIRLYKDKAGNPVSGTVRLAKQLGDIKYSLGKNIKRAQIANYVTNKIDNKLLPLDANGIYMVLTSKDVIVERFCMGSCGFHGSTMAFSKGKVVYAHIGDPFNQCPGLCAWPYAIPAYGPPGPALVAPNGVGTDGMIMNIATILAGAATNPFNTGYFQGDALAPLEAVTACPGIFGAGAYPGYPGNLMVDKISRASYNAYGANGRKFLLPAVWDPVGLNCKVVA